MRDEGDKALGHRKPRSRLRNATLEGGALGERCALPANTWLPTTFSCVLLTILHSFLCHCEGAQVIQ